MVLGKLVSHFERTKLEFYLILYPKITYRWIEELSVKNGNHKGTRRKYSITPKYETIRRK